MVANSKDLRLVSIIMPLYNAEKYVAEAIQSVVNQTYTNWELIVVNDGSTDNSLEVAKHFESEKIKVFSWENKGASAARNYGYYQSKGEYIKFFDADDVLSANMIELQLKALENSTDHISISSWGRFYADDINSFKLTIQDIGQDFNPIDWILWSWKDAQPMTQPGMILIPRDVITTAGVWNEKLSLIDDFEFFTRIILKCTQVIITKDAILYYRSGVSNALSGRKSKMAVESAVLSAQLATSNLLEALDNTETRRICANCLMTLVYEHKIFYPDIILPLEKKIKELGGSDLEIKKGKIFNFIQSILGWYYTSLLIKYFKR